MNYNLFKLLLFVSFFVLSDCSQKPTIGNIVPDHKWSYEDLKSEYKQCRGRGQLISKGTLRGKLTFFFTVRDDSTYIQFRDFLGRRTLYLQFLGNEVYAWDILQDKWFLTSQIQSKYPFLIVLEPTDLTRYFWGIDPQFKGKEHPKEFIFDHKSISVTFQTTPGNVGPMVSKAMIQINDNQNQIEIEIEEREYGMSYPRLIRAIPPTILHN